MTATGQPHDDIATDATDVRLMWEALELARTAGWRTHPNPMVGALIVLDGEIVGRGYHQAAGLDHAEVAALKAADRDLVGATLYVTLEPCNHVARTPPCTEAILKAGLARVVVGSVDPDPRVSGAGIRRLRDAGVEVTVGVLESECRALNAPFFKRVQTGRPWLTAKVAMSLDGRIAAHTGHSQWITGEASRRWVHTERARHDAIMVGTGTLLADDPRLTARGPDTGFSPPLRVVLDRLLRAPRDAAVFRPAEAPTLLVTDVANVDAARRKLDGSAEVVGVPTAGDLLDLDALFELLARRNITTVLCEGGGEILASLLHTQLVDEYLAFVAPKLIGGRDAPGPVGGRGVDQVDQALALEFLDVQRMGPDLLIRARPIYED